MTLWLSTIPSWWSFTIVLLFVNAVAIGLMLGIRRWSIGMGVVPAPGVVNSWATCTGSLCALLFAFTIVTLWNAVTAAHTAIDGEAAAIRLVARDITPAQMPLLRNYVKDMLAEWPKLCDGDLDPALDASLASLQRVAKAKSPVYDDDIFRQLGVLEDSRNRRWQRSASAVPDELWIGLIVLSLAVLCVLAAAVPERIETHLFLTIVIATALGTLFWVATVLEYPFCGRTSIQPDEILSILRGHLI